MSTCLVRLTEVKSLNFLIERKEETYPKPDDMAQFVNDNSEFVAVFTDRNGLSSVSSFADKRTASGDMRRIFALDLSII